MPLGLGIAAAGIGGGIASAIGSSQAAKAQSGAATNAMNTMQAMFSRAEDYQRPIWEQGTSGLNTLMKLITPGANMTDTLSQIPGFQFLQDWGQKAVKNMGSTRGLGGNVGTALANFATGTAQNNAFFPLVQSLLGVSQLGAGAANSLTGAATQTGANIGGQFTNQGNAQAAGILGQSNAISNIFGSLASASILNSLGGGGSSGGGAWQNPDKAVPLGSGWYNK